MYYPTVTFPVIYCPELSSVQLADPSVAPLGRLDSTVTNWTHEESLREHDGALLPSQKYTKKDQRELLY